MGFAEFKDGWKKHRAGEPKPGANADPDVLFGWNAREDATSKPTPGAPAPHIHGYTLQVPPVSSTTDAA